MKKYLLFCIAISVLLFFSCTKKIAAGSLVGKWVLTRICVCYACTDSLTAIQAQTLVFSVNGQADLYGATGNATQHYSGTYAVTTSSYGKVLNIDLSAPDSVSDFLYVPGSIINGLTSTTLTLELNTPYANDCAHVNTYTRR
jgi:hypothetical protein